VDALEPLVLRGPTVTLRPLTLADAGALAGAASESRDQYVYTRVPDGVEDARRYIELALADRAAGHRMPFAIVWQERVVGSTSYLDVQQWRWPAGSPRQRTDGPDSVEIGSTWLAASAQRTRCNTEAKHLLLSQAFDVWEVYRVALKTDERNAKSRRAIERLGARFEGVHRADMPAQDGSVRSSAYYSIVQAEWPDVRKKLEDALRQGGVG
jgi:RimJ/RimL family protein N-acetyltransferase